MIRNRSQRLGARSTACGYAINYGIKTGFNKAFIIDNETKEALVAEDPRSAEIIKPVLRGRDIQRYRAEWAGKWLIATHNGYGDVPPVEIDDYPAIKDFLDRHYERLAKRYDKGRTPYNLRNCAYHADFQKEKILWIELVGRGRFAYDESGLYPEATTFLMTGTALKYLCAVLNSLLVSWFLRNAAPTSGMGTLRWKKVYVETIPVPQIGEDRKRLFVSLVDNIIEAQARDPNADTKEWEQGIERLVFDLYGLTEDETRVTVV